MFIIRSQGFFFTDEYYDPTKKFKQVVRKTFATKAEADAACAELAREWIKAEPIGEYVFDNEPVEQALKTYLVAEFPDESFDFKFGVRDVSVPRDATDEQVDEIIRLTGVTFAQVFEVKAADKPARPDRDLHFGPDDD
jgi:hypothetical protein